MTPARTTKPMSKEILIVVVGNFVTYCYRHLGKDETAFGKMGDHIQIAIIDKIPLTTKRYKNAHRYYK